VSGIGPSGKSNVNETETVPAGISATGETITASDEDDEDSIVSIIAPVDDDDDDGIDELVGVDELSVFVLFEFPPVDDDDDEGVIIVDEEFDPGCPDADDDDDNV